MKHKTKGFIAMILALCLMMSLGIGALAEPSSDPQDAPVVNPGDGGMQDDPKTYTVNYICDPGAVVTAWSKWEGGSTTDIIGDSTTYSDEGGAGFQLYASLNEGYENLSFEIKDSNGNDISSNWTEPLTNGIKFSAKYSDFTVYVKATPKTYNIYASTDGNGSIEVTSPAAYNSTVNVEVTPNTNYELASLIWSYNGTEADITNTKSFTMPASDVTVTATFKQVETPEPEPETKYYVSASDLAYCTVEVEGGEGKNFEAGDTVIFTVAPHAGYEISSVWLTPSNVTLNSLGNGKYSFTMPAQNVKIYASCTPEYWPGWNHWHNVDTWSNSVDGGISCDADMALAGSEVTFRVWHNYKYDYYDYDVYVLNDRTGNRVSLDYSAYDDEYSFTMPEDDVTICVYFDYVGTYSITKDVEGDGSIYVRSSADYRDTVWIEASPNAGQSLTSLRVFYGEPWAYGDKGYYGYWDEADVHYSEYWDAYYFTMPADDVVVYARFTDGATVDVIAGDHGDAKVSSRYAEKGDWVYITAYPDEGYEVDSVTVTDSLGRSVKVTELSYDYFLFTMPGTSVDVKVTFRAKDYDVFYDVSRGDWYYKAVRFVHEKGIMEGTGTHYFSPEADLSRGMLATILYRLEGSPSVSGYSGFTDVADTAYYAKAVAWAKANGIVNGVTATAYEPDTAVTREELAAILCRYAAFKGKDTAISYDYLAGFSDANTSHVYARPALNWAVAYDIINGQGNGVLAPRATATRAEVAQVLMNYLEVFD